MKFLFFITAGMTMFFFGATFLIAFICLCDPFANQGLMVMARVIGAFGFIVGCAAYGSDETDTTAQVGDDQP